MNAASALISLLLLLLGFAALISGGNLLVQGAATVARKLRVPPIAIALTLVAFGTSAPEWVVSLVAASAGQTDLIFGNVIGSNIFNVALVLGVAAIIRSLPVQKYTVRVEVPLAILASVVVWLQARDGGYGRVDGMSLLVLFAVFVGYVALLMRKREGPVETGEKELSLPLAAIQVIVGIPLLILGGNIVVHNASTIARIAGISERVIGATVVAAGTSLPELVTSVVAVAKRQTDIAVGNIVGSNIFNTFLILGSAAAIQPIALPTGGEYDLMVNFLVVAVLLVLLFVGRGREITRWKGIALLTAFVSYETYLIIG